MTDRAPKYPRLSRLGWNLRLFGLPQPVRDLWMFAVTALVVVALVQISDQTETTTASLCALRADLEARVMGGDAFLKEHPNGAFGLSAATLRNSIEGQRRTIMALGGLDCS